MKNVIVTGASRGFGHAIARRMLDKGYRVYGLSRTVPADLVDEAEFRYVPVDLSQTRMASAVLSDYFLREQRVSDVAYLFLNAGMFGDRVMRVSDIAMDEMKQIVDLNVWANKLLLDLFLRSGVPIATCVASASMAGVRARAGNGGYAISKATLNMMLKLYALEHPATFFAVLGLCSLNTRLFDHTLYPPADPNQFPDIAVLQKRAQLPGYLTTPEQRAQDVDQVLHGPLREQLVSGEFVDMRSLLASAAASVTVAA